MKKCLVVVDYQNDFVDGSLGFEDATKLDKPIYDKITEYVKNNEDVYFTLDTHYENYLETVEGKKLPITHCIKNTNGHNIYGMVGSLTSVAKEIIEKDTFGSIDLAIILKNEEYEEITFCGLVSNICVFTNAVMAKTMLPNSKIIVDASLVSSNDLNLQNKSFDILENLHIEVINRK